ncbi:MAG: ccsB [Bacilli bacterium]|nr:ccsB [Bacilli bacterium]
MLLGASSLLYGVAFGGDLLSSILYIIGVTGRNIKLRSGGSAANLWTKWGYTIAIIAVASQFIGLLLRWTAGGHAPVSSMFEYMSFWSFTIMLAFVLINAFYRSPRLGAFACPVGLTILAYAMVFPQEAQPLIPALQSYWLNIHVTTAALGEGVLTIGFAAALMYLLNTTDTSVKNRSTRFLELVIFLFLTLFAYVVTALVFKVQHYAIDVSDPLSQNPASQMTYHLPPLAGPTGSVVGSLGSLLGIPLPLFPIPGWMQGAQAALKFNTLVWTFLSSIVLYGILRLINGGKSLVTSVSSWVQGLDADELDELSYRAIAIGYPIFALGALVFAMIWAQEAWGSYWSWDPKETWALITFLYYTLYLHLRLSRGWEGPKSAWLAVIGFVVILFLLVGVNLVIVGLHSYAVPPGM